MVETVKILGIAVSVLNPQLAIALIHSRVRSRLGGYITVPDVYNITLAAKDPELARCHRNAFLVSPDGSPLSIVGRLLGHSEMQKVCGPDLLMWACESGVSLGHRHYFFGGDKQVAARLSTSLSQRFPGLVVVGAESPDFKPITTEADLESCARIRSAQPDIVWVGLGAPKQEYWMAANAEHLPGALLIGVGAAFNFHSGHVRRAPLWMQRMGLEWAFRLSQEPRRLWRRYLLNGLYFVANAVPAAVLHRLRYSNRREL